MNSNNSQTSVEFIILFATVISVLLIMLASLGILPSVGRNAEYQFGNQIISQGDIAILGAVSDGNNTLIKFQNNLKEPIIVTAISINNNSQNLFFPLFQGGTFIGNITSYELEPEITVTYLNTKNQKVYSYPHSSVSIDVITTLPNSSENIFWDNLIGYWSFDYSNSTHVFDLSNSNAHGIIQNAVISKTNTHRLKFQQQAILDGDDDYIDIGNEDRFDIEQDTGFSFLAWIYPEEYNGWIFHKGGSATAGYRCYIQTTVNHITCRLRNQSAATLSPLSTTNSIELNEWQHIAIIFNDNEDVTFYINGEDKTWSSYNTSNFHNMTNSESLYFGKKASFAEDFNGSIDEVMIFNRSLSQEEITKIYNMYN